ncbi:MAG TPA: SCO family protein [Hyphomicrobiaceae bacterium]|nr:SCO family protein [Hyphomicrobiaceae bacterium]
MKRIRYVAWAAIAVLAIGLGLYVMRGSLPKSLSDLPLAAKFGAPFMLTAHDGTRFDSKSLAGKPFAVFFGFTFCPEVCPTSMLELTQAIEALGPDADKMRYLFISVDPARDTPEHLKTYIGNFDKRIIGLTGSEKEIANVARAYRVFYEKVQTKEGYTINHTATIYLMGRNGELVSTLAYQEKAETRVAKLRKLIAGGR